ncbi:MAG: leucyl aminopeptidase family protein [Cryobacterium sp.]|nr:leucyl aminopeptidase family protein [Oligoflexia bacterium]
MASSLKPFPKASLPVESIHTVRFFYGRDLAKLKKAGGFPTKLLERVEITNRAPAAHVTNPTGYDRTETYCFLNPGISTFALHSFLRKAVDFSTEKTRTFAIDLSGVDPTDAVRILNAVGNLTLLAAYEPTKFGLKASQEKKPKNLPAVVLLRSELPFARASEIFSIAQSQAEAANLVRLLSELPPNELTPALYLGRIRKLAKEWGATVEFFDRKALEKRGANGFLAVVRADPEGVYGIAKVSWKPRGRKSQRRIALVGKGLCFDTGGYNIKSGEHMFDMHRDMTGSALALATLGHLIRQETQDEIHIYLALAENLISASAYKPNEVVVASNGVSIEVVDTDAEGRMALSDTLVLACENKPDLIIDFATLTGATVRALDNRRAGVFSNRDHLRELAVQAGDAVGERLWGFPIGEDYWEGIHSEIADVRQCAVTNNCDHIYAATFLSSFVRPETPWIHVDLAAEAHKGGLGLSARDVTGFGVRLTEEILRRFEPLK